MIHFKVRLNGDWQSLGILTNLLHEVGLSLSEVVLGTFKKNSGLATEFYLNW